MAKLTLLQMTQDILGEMDSDPVNSIDDTTESLQVSQIIKTTYFNIVSQRDWPFLRTLTALTGLGDVTNPTKMQMPTNVNKVFWVKYNKKTVKYISPDEFLYILHTRNTAADNVDANGYITDRDPTYWTTYDDEYVYFDSYDSAVDTTLQQSKCDAYCTTIPSWTASDAFTPTLPEKMFPVLLAAAKSASFNALKQIGHAAAEAFAGRGIVRAQNEAWRTKDAEAKTDGKINYGRK